MRALSKDARQGRDGARLHFDDYADKDGKKHNTGPADFQAGAHGHEHQRVTVYLKNCVEVTP